MPAGKRDDRPARAGAQGSRRAPSGRGPRARPAGDGDKKPRRDTKAGPADRERSGGRDQRRGTDSASGPAGPDATTDPQIDEDVTAQDLDEDLRRGLSQLKGVAATAVARHLVMAQRWLDEDPELAYEHAMAARRRAGRTGFVREAAGVAAYRAGKYAEALNELRAARRMTGSAEYLPMMADCERGLGRPRRALELSNDPGVARLDTVSRIELLIVAAGARRDLGEHEAAVVALQVPELRSRSTLGWVARLRYAYADALAAAGRRDEAARWFVRAAEADAEGDTDAEERAVELGA